MRSFRSIVALATILLTTLLAACGSGGSVVSDASPISLTITADRSTALADGADAIIFTATLKDETGVPLQGKDVAFSVSQPNTTSSPATTDANGQVVFTLRRTAEQVALYGETVNVMAIYANQGPSMLVQFTSGPILDLFDNGGGTFTVTGKGLLGIQGMDLSVGYESTALANPRVEWGDLVSSTIKASNLSAPGTIRLALITTTAISGTGRIATLHFDEVATSARKINSYGGYLLTSSGIRIPATFVMPPSTTTSAVTRNIGGTGT